MISFTDKTYEHIGFKSSNKEDRYVVDHGCQTNEISFVEKSVQSRKSKNAESQTEGTLANYVNKTNDNSQELLLFLRKSVPIAIDALKDNVKSKAFSNYKVTWLEEPEISSCLLKLRHDEMEDKMPVTSLSWNSSSSVIAASFGSLDHEDCCMHLSYMCTWNVDRTKLNPTRGDRCLELNSCLNVVAWHPVHPSVIAGGTFNGELKIWDLNKEEPLQVSTTRTGDSHLEAVSGLKWISDGRSQRLFTTGGGGRMFLWEYNQIKATLIALNKFYLLSECLPRQIRAKVGSGRVLSVTSFDMSHFDETSFVVGTDAGYLFKCSLLVQYSAGDSNSSAMKSPVVSSSSPHQAPVHSIQFSHHHQDLFLSSSCDGTFVIHSLHQMKPLKRVHTNSASVFHAQWSPWRPSFVAVATFEGSMQLYDLASDLSLPVQEVKVTEKGPATYVMFNSRRPGLMCAGDAIGNITVWHLNSASYEEDKKDLNNLLKLLEQ